jgi:hypothetical protein
MRIKRSLQAAALTAIAVVLGLVTVQGSYALWNTAATVPPGTVSAASFEVKMTNTANLQAFTNMTLTDGTSANLAITPNGTLTPGGSAYGGVAVTNSTDAGGLFNTVISAAQPGIANVNGGTLATYVSVSAKTATNSSECATSTGYTAISASGLPSPTVAKGSATIFCFQVSLSSTAPSTVKGQAVTISVPLTARQLCGVPSGC